jgi:hypothetical protein
MGELVFEDVKNSIGDIGEGGEHEVKKSSGSLCVNIGFVCSNINLVSVPTMTLNFTIMTYLFLFQNRYCCLLIQMML